MKRGVVEVVGAAVVRDGRVMLCRRAVGEREAGFWEFPGGKVHEGETAEECLARELEEELGIGARVGEFVAENVHAYEHVTIRLRVYRVEWVTGELALSVHDAVEWVQTSALLSYDLAPADVPIAEGLRG